MLVTGQLADVIAVMLLTLGCQRRIVGVFLYLIDQMILFAPVAFSRLYSPVTPLTFFGGFEESGGKLLVYQPERHCENGGGHADFNEFGSSFYGSVGAGHPSGDIPDSVNHRHGPVDLSVPDENR